MVATLTLYHGSQKIVEHPVFGVGNPRNDYGLGFYCTENEDLAKEWACAEESDGFSNRYRFDSSGLSVLDLADGRHHILNWLAVLLENRTVRLGGRLAKDAHTYITQTFTPSYRSADVVRGYRADDSYFAFASAFLNGIISLEQLEEAMYLGKLGEQIVLKSEAAFERLVFEGSSAADAALYYSRRIARDAQAKAAYRELEAAGGRSTGQHYVIDVLREGWTDDDARLRRVLPE